MKLQIKKIASFIFGILVILMLGVSGEELRPYIFFPLCATLSIFGTIDAIKEYKSKEVWSAEKQLKTWITGKSSYTFFKAFFVIIFTLAWLIALISL